MAYEQTAVYDVTTFDSDFRSLSGARLPDSTIFALFYDADVTGPRDKAARLYFSLGDGRAGTWVAESWSQQVGSDGNGDGGTDPHLLLQPDGVLWAAMSTYDGNDFPVIMQRDPDQQAWGGQGRYFIGFEVLQTTHSLVAFFSAVPDPAHIISGIYNIATCYNVTSGPDSGKVMYSDVGTASPVEVDSNTNYDYCKIACMEGGIKTIVTRDTTGDLWSFPVLGSGSTVVIGARVQVDSSVEDLQDIAIQPNTQPAVIYRKLVGGIHRLHLSEYSALSASWTSQRVWDGTNDNSFQPGQSLTYDQQGSIFVIGAYDFPSPTSDTEIAHWQLLRGVDPLTTDWINLAPRTSGVGTSKTSFGFGTIRNPVVRGFQPNRPIQGMVSLFHAYDPSGDQSVQFANLDHLDDQVGTYPTIFPRFGGEPFFRLADTETRSGVTLPDEGDEGSESLTIKPSFTYIEDTKFEVNEVRFEAGYIGTVMRFGTGRTLYTLRFNNLDTGTAAIVRDFFESRQDDGKMASFNLPNEDATTVEAHVTPTPLRIIKEAGGELADSVWSISVQLLEKI